MSGAGREVFEHLVPEAEQELAAWAASVLAGRHMAAGGLYLATTTGGGRESVAFWREARSVGLAFANPRLFPWALANSPTGAVARALGIRGPTYTLVGADSAVEAVLDHAGADLADGTVTEALVVGLDGFPDRFELAAAVLGAEATHGIGRAGSELPPGNRRSAAAALAERLGLSPAG